MNKSDPTAQFTLTPALWSRDLVLLNRPSRTHATAYAAVG